MSSLGTGLRVFFFSSNWICSQNREPCEGRVLAASGKNFWVETGAGFGNRFAPKRAAARIDRAAAEGGGLWGGACLQEGCCPRVE